MGIWEEDRKIPSDLRTAKIIQDLANQIYNFIQVEIDCPSLHDNGNMPILDLAVQMHENNIVYRYYRKEMVNFNVLMASSAMPFKMRRVSLAQEVVRILRNTSRRLDTKEKLYFLSEFSLRLKVSGYPAQVRLNIIKSGMRAYEKQIERDEEGIRPLYRPKGYEEEERQKKKARTKMTWYKPSDTVLFVPPTPNGELQKRIKHVVESVGKNQIRVKVVERAGRKISSILPGLKEETDCTREDCVVHSSGGKGNCNREGAVYRGECVTCETDGMKSVYIGETGRSTYVRGKQHVIAMKNPMNHQSNAFAKHIIEKHNGKKETEFKVNVVDTFQKPLERQVREGIEILRAQADIVMNSRLDHFQPAIKRIIFSNILDE